MERLRSQAERRKDLYERTRPFADEYGVQTAEQLPTEGGSHSSPRPAWMVPSPQDSFWQVALQPSSLAVLPSSHCSLIWLTVPSPQIGS